METHNPTSNDQVLLTWQAPARHIHNHSKNWYVAMGSILGLLLLYSLWSVAWSFLVVLLIATGTYLWMHKAKPEQKTIAIEKQGYRYGNDFRAWLDCSGFWVMQTPQYAELHIAHKDARKEELVILTGPVNTLELRALLQQFLEEIPNKHEKILDTISRICKL